MLAQVPRYPVSPNPFQKLDRSSHDQMGMHILAVPEGPSRQRPRKSCFFGIEVSEQLVWENWELGGEITKVLKLKNIQVKMQKLRFRPPSTKFFTTLFPQTIILSQGTSFSLPVTFRPLEKREHTDSIVFETGEDAFTVQLFAALPHHDLELPESIEVPMCAAYDSSEASFHIHNTSMLPTSFSWNVPEPFLLSPANGSLDPGSQCKINILFRPEAALMYEDIATCLFGSEGKCQKNICLRGIAKYPHLLVSAAGYLSQTSGQEDTQSVLDFGCVAVGSTVEKYIDIHNPSPVRAPFRIVRVLSPALMDSAFSCDIQQALAPAEGKLRVPLRFSPQTVGVASIEYFYVVTAGNISKSILKAVGTCKGPLVSLASSVVNFGCANLGETVLRSLEFTNTSDVPAYFQFSIDCSHSVFSIDHSCGILPGETSLTLNIAFQPTHPMNYYRKVACLIHHMEPVYLDFIGTCHSEQWKPAILLPKHLHLYHTKLARGLTCYPPDILSSLLAENKLQLDQGGALMLPPQDHESNPAKPQPVVDCLTEYFDDGYNTDASHFSAHVTADTQEFLFHSAPQSSPLCLTNHTKGKLTVVWTAPKGSPFSVSPETCDLPPLKSTAFRVNFTPSRGNWLYGAQLECFASYKVMQDHRHIKDCTLCPPWCLTVRVSGHTFQPGREHFIPHYSLLSPRVVFPAVPQEVTTYRSLLLQNTGDLPITFSLDAQHSRTVTVKPTSGMVLPGAHEIFTLKTTPNEGKIHKLSIPLQLNYSPRSIQEIIVLSSVEKPKIALEGDGTLFFKPTCVGSSSERTYIIKNVTRLPLRFEWKIPSTDSTLLSVTPQGGIIQPNESLVQAWCFSPQEEKEYVLKTSLTFWASRKHCSPQPSKKTRLCLKVIGMGSKGSIAAEQPLFDMGDVLVGSSQSCDLVLLNNGCCALDYTLTVDQDINGHCDLEEIKGDPIALELEFSSGMIPARSKVIIRATAKPARRVHYSWSIGYQILTPRALQQALDGQALCKVSVEGVYPSLLVSDARSAGSVQGISKLQLWKLFSLDTLNAYLQRDPTPAELTYRVPTRHSIRRCPSVFTPVLLDFNFGAAPLGSEPSSVLLMFENNGTVPVEWTFLFPADQQIELEYWAESGEFDHQELHEMRIQDNKLFSVSPRAGRLLPGQQRKVQLKYRHEFPGTDRLPVLLKLSHGREILLNFIGVTVERDRHYIHFTSNKHTFAPVAIGIFSPPKQFYELYNGGSVPVSYYLDLDPLQELEEGNFKHPVFQCLNPKGEVLPGNTAFIEWIFSPLEAKTYTVLIPIHILGGDSALVSFCGAGYDARALGEAAPVSGDCAPFPVPAIQRVPLPGQHVFLSEERVSFRDSPVYSKRSQIIFLYNTSQTERVLFNWQSAWESTSEAVLISPQNGELAPEESTPCILSLEASGSPGFYYLDLVCQVTSEQALMQYQRELQEWERERDKQASEFTLTDTNAAFDGQRAVCTKVSAGSVQKPRKCKALPPVQRPSAGGLSRAERRAQREEERVWRKPEPPKPFPLHLGVTVRSHCLEEFHANFPLELHKHYIRRSMKQKGVTTPLESVDTVEPEPEPKDLCVTCATERGIITDVLTYILRSLLDDTQFQQSLIESLAEPVPYFAQFCSKGISNVASLPEGPEGASAAHCVSAPTGDRGPQTSPAAQKPNVHLAGRQSSESYTQESIQQQLQLEMKKNIKRLPEFCNLTEEILVNTLQNIIIEASCGEVVLTARPRVIALPPATSRQAHPRGSSRAGSAKIPHLSPVPAGHKRELSGQSAAEQTAEGGAARRPASESGTESVSRAENNNTS
ncbi:cilia- and flagella-associated protein 65 isoform X1 [Polyodon spathula]|uniref:cilia- and flagella-associated protein 65 isoform X1 n=1 Tax=Polyodon spathula TaxID=7913 RepID=UPI001B7E7EC5|nr:cilia- and flagella-associated protein 65 isoform X1 [Polyodon spathula]